MPYSVTCECGKAHEVSTGEAGTTLTCSCGRAVSVPSYRVLKEQTPERQIEALIREGKAPIGENCSGCREPTDRIVYVVVTYGGAHVPGGMTLQQMMIWWSIFCCVGWVAAVAMLILRGTVRAGEKPLGQQTLRLPIRLCQDCPRQPNALHHYLCRIPLYERLLAMHPDANVSHCE